MFSHLEESLGEFVSKVEKEVVGVLEKMPWMVAFREQHFLYMHWPVEASVLEPFLADKVTLDTYEGQAWLSLAPFAMTDLHMRDFPVMPGTGNIQQLEVRTYVKVDGIPATWYLALYCSNELYTWLSNHMFHLPYYSAELTVEDVEGQVHAHCLFEGNQTLPASEFAASYRPVGEVFRAQEGSLEAFLHERYTLFTTGPDGQLYKGEERHEPWPLQQVEMDIRTNTILKSLGLHPTTEPLCFFASGVHDVGWPVLPYYPKE